jgi:hypothetical protein
MTPLLPSCYFGPGELYGLLARHPKAVIDTGEHYVRQSHRTRTRIIGPNGAQDLCVPIVHDHGRKKPMHQIRSAYGKTPWFIHYIEDIEAVLLQRHERLIDLNLATLRLGMQWLGLTTGIDVRGTYVEDRHGLTDLRSLLHPKKALPPGVPPVLPYPQVFADRLGFQRRTSVIDLVMNTGPDAHRYLGLMA